MNNIKKIISLLLILVLCFAMFACGQTGTINEQDSTNKQSNSSTQKPIDGNPFGTIATAEGDIPFTLEYLGEKYGGEAYKVTMAEDNGCDPSIDIFTIMYGGADLYIRLVGDTSMKKMLFGLETVITLDSMETVKNANSKYGFNLENMIAYKKCETKIPGWNADIMDTKYTH